MYPPPAQAVIKIRYRTASSVLFVVLGALLLVVGGLSLAGGTFTVGIVLGPLMLLIGILSFSKPMGSYDAATGTLLLQAMIGPKVTAYGAAKGERLWFDGKKVLRVLPGGKQKNVWLTFANAEDKARLVQAVVAAQQQAPHQ